MTDAYKGFHYAFNEFNIQSLNDAFQLYKKYMNKIFRLFHYLLISLPHIPEWQKRQWDIASSNEATAILTLATYNQYLSDLQTGNIAAQQHKTDLLTDDSKLHKQHLHKLDTMVDNI